MESIITYQVVHQGAIKRIECCDENGRTSFEPECLLILKEHGRFNTNKIVATLRGKQALHLFKEGELVLASLIFTVEDSFFGLQNKIYVSDIKLINNINDVMLYEQFHFSN